MTFLREPASMGAVAILCLVAELANAGHYLLVRHSICAEHGETIDVGGHEGAHEAQSAGGATSWRAAAPACADGHEHCTAGLGRSGAALETPPASPALLASVRPARSLAVAEPHASATLLFLAPKTSPPA